MNTTTEDIANPPVISRLALIGVGMIGGSFVWSLKRAGLVKHVVGVDENIAALTQATEQGIIDSKSHLDSLQPVDAVVIATPVGAMFEVFKALNQHSWIKQAIITDVGSTKQSVLAACERACGELPPLFIPAHPIAGREHMGVAHAEEMMFYGHRVVLTPHANSDADALIQVKTWWQAIGAKVDVMDAKTHDEILAATSHLPHVLAYALMQLIAESVEKNPRANARDAAVHAILDYAAGGFKSFTRTASSNPIMWRDICLNNKTAVLDWLVAYQDTLKTLTERIEAEDGEALLDIFTRAKAERDKYLLQ